MVARPETGSRVDWSATVRESLKQGWRVGKKLNLRFRKPQRQPLVWLFLDASRSAGALKFLGAAREAIRSLGLRQAARRFQILLLQHDDLQWRVKRGTAQAADQFLRLPAEHAAGDDFDPANVSGHQVWLHGAG